MTIWHSAKCDYEECAREVPPLWSGDLAGYEHPVDWVEVRENGRAGRKFYCSAGCAVLALGGLPHGGAAQRVEP